MNVSVVLFVGGGGDGKRIAVSNPLPEVFYLDEPKAPGGRLTLDWTRWSYQLQRFKDLDGKLYPVYITGDASDQPLNYILERYGKEKRS